MIMVTCSLYDMVRMGVMSGQLHCRLIKYGTYEGDPKITRISFFKSCVSVNISKI